MDYPRRRRDFKLSNGSRSRYYFLDSKKYNTTLHDKTKYKIHNENKMNNEKFDSPIEMLNKAYLTILDDAEEVIRYAGKVKNQWFKSANTLFSGKKQTSRQKVNKKVILGSLKTFIKTHKNAVNITALNQKRLTDENVNKREDDYNNLSDEVYDDDYYSEDEDSTQNDKHKRRNFSISNNPVKYFSSATDIEPLEMTTGVTTTAVNFKSLLKESFERILHRYTTTSPHILKNEVIEKTLKNSKHSKHRTIISAPNVGVLKESTIIFTNTIRKSLDDYSDDFEDITRKLSCIGSNLSLAKINALNSNNFKTCFDENTFATSNTIVGNVYNNSRKYFAVESSVNLSTTRITTNPKETGERGHNITPITFVLNNDYNDILVGNESVMALPFKILTKAVLKNVTTNTSSTDKQVFKWFNRSSVIPWLLNRLHLSNPKEINKVKNKTDNKKTISDVNKIYGLFPFIVGVPSQEVQVLKNSSKLLTLVNDSNPVLPANGKSKIISYSFAPNRYDVKKEKVAKGMTRIKENPINKVRSSDIRRISLPKNTIANHLDTVDQPVTLCIPRDWPFYSELLQQFLSSYSKRSPTDQAENDSTSKQVVEFITNSTNNSSMIYFLLPSEMSNDFFKNKSLAEKPLFIPYKGKHSIDGLEKLVFVINERTVLNRTLQPLLSEKYTGFSFQMKKDDENNGQLVPGFKLNITPDKFVYDREDLVESPKVKSRSGKKATHHKNALKSENSNKKIATKLQKTVQTTSGRKECSIVTVNEDEEVDTKAIRKIKCTCKGKKSSRSTQPRNPSPKDVTVMYAQNLIVPVEDRNDGDTSTDENTYTTEHFPIDEDTSTDEHTTFRQRCSCLMKGLKTTPIHLFALKLDKLNTLKRNGTTILVDDDYPFKMTPGVGNYTDGWGRVQDEEREDQTDESEGQDEQGLDNLAHKRKCLCSCSCGPFAVSNCDGQDCKGRPAILRCMTTPSFKRSKQIKTKKSCTSTVTIKSQSRKMLTSTVSYTPSVHKNKETSTIPDGTVSDEMRTFANITEDVIEDITTSDASLSEFVTEIEEDELGGDSVAPDEAAASDYWDIEIQGSLVTPSLTSASINEKATLAEDVVTPVTPMLSYCNCSRQWSQKQLWKSLISNTASNTYSKDHMLSYFRTSKSTAKSPKSIVVQVEYTLYPTSRPMPWLMKKYESVGNEDAYPVFTAISYTKPRRLLSLEEIRNLPPRKQAKTHEIIRTLISRCGESKALMSKGLYHAPVLRKRSTFSPTVFNELRSIPTVTPCLELSNHVPTVLWLTKTTPSLATKSVVASEINQKLSNPVIDLTEPTLIPEVLKVVNDVASVKIVFGRRCKQINNKPTGKANVKKKFFVFETGL